MDKEKAIDKLRREAAINWRMRNADINPTTREMALYRDGFRDGYDARESGWVAIKSEDDLPKEEGQYVWRYRSNNAAYLQWWSPTVFNIADAKKYAVDTYAAYLPIPEYRSK